MSTTAAQPGVRRPPTRRLKIALVTLAALGAALPAIALVVLFNVDWNQARPWLNAKAGEALGRPFTIAGDLSLTWTKPAETGAAAAGNWRDALPWPHLVANDVHLGNPVGMAAGDIATVRQLSFSLNPFALLGRRIQIPLLRFDAPVVDLERAADGVNNWTFVPQERPSAWRLDLDRVVFTKGVVRLNDAVEHAALTADVDTIDPVAAAPAYGVRWTLRGKYNGAPASGSGKAGAVLSLERQDAPYPIEADIRLGATHITVAGTLTRPTALAALDLHLTVAGASAARLYALTGVLLPETPAFHTAGRLLGELGPHGSYWIYDKFTGKVGDSDIGGRLDYRSGKPRGILSGEVGSRLLQFADLGPLVGADSNASKTARGLPPVQPNNKVLPVETFNTERWTSVDADVRFAAERVVREHQLPISKLATHLTLKDGVLTLDPLGFRIAGGEMRSSIELDGNGRTGRHAIKAKAKVSARHIHIKELFPAIGDLQATVGEINGDALLSATGNSPATLLAGANGEVKTLIDQGMVSKLLLEKMGLNVGNIVLAKLFGDKQVKLNCMATDFAVTNGLMQIRTFVADTEEAVITATGTINLDNERLDLVLRPETKSLRVFSLRAPLYVGGSLGDPHVSVDKGVLALKAGGALALGALAAPAALLPLVNMGPGKDSACARLLAEARVKPQAPPAGKSTK